MRKLIIASAVAAAACGVVEHEEALNGGQHSAAVSGEATIDAGSTTDWVYFQFSKGATVAIASPSMSNGWDIAIRRTQLATNSGTSGMATGGACSTGMKDWTGMMECPMDGYEADAKLPLPGPPGSGEFSGNPVLNAWYDYDPATHAVSSKGLVYCVRTADGKFAKLTIASYAGGKMAIKWVFQPNGTRTMH